VTSPGGVYPLVDLQEYRPPQQQQKKETINKNAKAMVFMVLF
jgi:hypothetical protein